MMDDDDVVSYVQRRMQPEPPVRGTDTLHGLLFQLIAGDSLASSPAVAELPELLSLHHLQFGILDARTVDELAVVTITNPATTDAPGALGDARMGASPGRTSACGTCGQQHHNCPGHFGRICLPHPVVNPLFVTMLTAVLQTLCFHCHRLRLSPFYITTLFPGRARQLQRIKAVGTLCMRQTQCQFCHAPTLLFKQQGIGIVARRVVGTGATAATAILVPATAIFATLMRLPEADLAALGFGTGLHGNHPANGVLSVLPVLPPVSRPAMRTMNLKTGNPFVVEDFSWV